MPAPLIIQQRIYLAYCLLFQGEDAKVRHQASIHRLLQRAGIITRNSNDDKNESSSIEALPSSSSSSPSSHYTTISPLIQEHGLDKVTGILQSLLKEGLFESPSKAKEWFSALRTQTVMFEPIVGGSRTIDPSSEESEGGCHGIDVAAAAASSRPKLRTKEKSTDRSNPAYTQVVIDRLCNNGLDRANAGSKISERDIDLFERTSASGPNHRDDRSDPSMKFPLMNPAQLPFRTQHHVLTKVQGVLEECCYEFTKEHIPSLLQAKDWDCVEALELSAWTSAVLHDGMIEIPVALRNALSRTFGGFPFVVNKIRNAAVHRERMSTESVTRLIDSAVRFTLMLSDTTRSSQLEELRRQLRDTGRCQQRNRENLNAKLEEAFNKIAYLRQELAEREREAIFARAADDEEYARLIAHSLEERMADIFGQATSDQKSHVDNHENDVLLSKTKGGKDFVAEQSTQEVEEICKRVNNADPPAREVATVEVSKGVDGGGTGRPISHVDLVQGRESDDARERQATVESDRRDAVTSDSLIRANSPSPQLGNVAPPHESVAPDDEAGKGPQTTKLKIEEAPPCDPQPVGTLELPDPQVFEQPVTLPLKIHSDLDAVVTPATLAQTEQASTVATSSLGTPSHEKEAVLQRPEEPEGQRQPPARCGEIDSSFTISGGLFEKQLNMESGWARWVRSLSAEGHRNIRAAFADFATCQQRPYTAI